MKRILTILFLLIPALAFGAEYGTTLADLRTLVRCELGENDVTRFPDSVLTGFINEGQLRVAIDCGAYRRKQSISLTNDSSFYGANADAIEGWPIQAISFIPDAKPSWLGLRWSLFSWMGISNTSRDRPRLFSGYVHGGEILLDGPPPDDTGTLYLWYRAKPTALSADTDTTNIPETDRPGIVHYAAFQAASSIEWDSKATTELGEYRWHVDHRLLDMVPPRYTPPTEEGGQ